MRPALAPSGAPAGLVRVDGVAASPEAALATHEDLCLLTKREGEDVYRLIGAAVAWPSDWHPAEKIGLPLRALHAPIAGYEEQLATGVDRFMETLRPGPIYARCNWFIAATGNRRWLPDRQPAEAFAHVAVDRDGHLSPEPMRWDQPATGFLHCKISFFGSPYL